MAGPVVIITDRDLGWKKLKRELLSATGGVYGKAGIIGEKASDEHKAKDGAQLTNVELALVHEFGLGVPERSFIRAAFDKSHPKYQEHLQKLVVAVYDGKMTIEQALGLLSAEAASDMRTYVLEGAGVPPPNAPSTIAEKGSSRPLVDSKQMINALNFAVEKGETEG